MAIRFDGRCALTGLVLEFEHPGSGRESRNDRRGQEQFYCERGIRIVYKIIYKTL